jgi:transcriptional regulator
MYSPEAFRIRDRGALLAQAAAAPFATVITCHGDSPMVSHLPLLVDAPNGRILGHLARANPQCEHFAAGARVLAIFHGPHGYVSPSVYEERAGAVPTWNYVVVHVKGEARLVDEPDLWKILDETVATFDPAGWRADRDDRLLRAKLAAIAGFEIAIAEVDGKWKVSQNRPPGDRDRVASWFEGGDEQSRALAAIMRSLR